MRQSRIIRSGKNTQELLKRSDKLTQNSEEPNDKAKSKNTETTDENLLTIYDHTKCWDANLECASGISDFDDEVQLARTAINMWPIPLLAMIEYPLLDLVGFDTIVELLMGLAGTISPLESFGTPLLFSLFLIMRCCLAEFIREKISDRVYEKAIKLKHQNVIDNLSMLYKMKVENAPGKAVHERALIYDKNVQILRTPLLNSKILLGPLTGLFLF